jgi:hypothetical protein
MPSMGKSSSVGLLVFPAILFALLCTGGCSHSPTPTGENDNSSSSNSSADPQLPFHDGDSTALAASDGVGGAPAIDPSRAVPPFAVSAAGSLPAGALLTVKLTDTVSGARTASGATFTAVLEDPVVINGKTVAARGTMVRGRVESARASAMKGKRSYVRLTLVSIGPDGREIRLQTSSLFASGESEVAVNTAFSPADASSGDSANVVHIQKGRLLTFRLSSPVFFPPADPAQMSKNSQPSRD